MDDKTLAVLKQILELLLQYFGPYGLVGVAFGSCVLIFLYRLYCDYQKRQEVNLALEEKEKSIQRLANEVRMYRATVLKEKFKWSEEEVERLLITADFKDPKEARAFLEAPKKSDSTKKGSEAKP